MRTIFTILACSTIGLLLSSCAEQDEASRSTQAAGGTVPWNRPEKWEGGGVLGSQMQQGQ